MVLARGEAAYGVVLVWSFVAVALKQERWPVGIAAAACALLCIASLATSLLHQKSAAPGGDYVQGYSEL